MRNDKIKFAPQAAINIKNRFSSSIFYGSIDESATKHAGRKGNG